MARRSWTWRRVKLSLAICAFLCAMGFGVRCAEDRQVGYTNDASMWIFVAAGLLAYYAAIAAYVIRRNARKRAEDADSVRRPSDISD